MDVSPEYIKMCTKAEEIQKPWSRETDQYSYYWCSVHGLGCSLGNSTWLPLQDQLQEMIYPHNNRDYSPLFELDSWHEHIAQSKGYYDDFATYEQLWLAFVMKSLYQKTWNGTEWVSQ